MINLEENVNDQQLKLPNNIDWVFMHWWLWSNIVEALKDKNFNFDDYYSATTFKRHIIELLFDFGFYGLCNDCFPCDHNFTVTGKCKDCLFINKACKDWEQFNNFFIKKNLKKCIKYAEKIRDWKVRKQYKDW
jgi:hypothetical protein